MNSCDRPLVSVCIPTYNGEEYLADTLESIFSQSYKNLEIIVSDDNSSDNTIFVLKKYQKSSPYPFIIINHIPAGIGSNWNNCVLHSKGEYIKFIFQDDLMDSDCIKKLLNIFLKNNNVGLVYSKRRFIGDFLNLKSTEWLKDYENLHVHWTSFSECQSGKIYLKYIKFFDLPKNKIGEPSAVLLKKNIFSKIGYFDLKMQQSLDYEFWYRIFKYYNVGFVDEVLVSIRIHNKQATIVNEGLTILDYDLYPKMIYKNFLLYLHHKLIVKLFFKYNKIGRYLNKKFLKKINGIITI